MKNIIIVSLIFFAPDLQGQPSGQKAFCKFVSLFNQQRFDAVYDDFNGRFQSQVDRAVVAGGLQMVFETNGLILSAGIERQTSNEGSYFAFGEHGVVKVSLSFDAEERIDGLRIKVVATSAPLPPPILVFNRPR